MTDVLWFAGILFLIIPGLWLWRLPFVQRMDLAARLAIALAGGMVIVTVLMFVYSIAHIPWTRVTLGLALLAIGAAAVFRLRKTERPADAGRKSWIFAGLFLLLTTYGVVTARETCADLLYFWGPKAVHFHAVGKIDTQFLGFVHYGLMHPDYPPLLPLTYAWGAEAARGVSWWGALLMTPLCLLAMVAAFQGIAGQAVGGRRAGWYGFLLSGIVGYGFAVGMAAGAGEPLLLLFEVIAVSALTFAPDDAGARAIAAIALCGAVLTKVEGAAFAVTVVIAYLLVTRRVLRTLALAAPAAILLGAWIFFVWKNVLLDQYGRVRATLHYDLLGKILIWSASEASYRVVYVPWIASIAPLTVTRQWKRAILPLLVACGSMASTIFFYLHTDNPGWWIKASAQRVLLTPLACLVVASAASSE